MSMISVKATIKAFLWAQLFNPTAWAILAGAIIIVIVSGVIFNSCGKSIEKQIEKKNDEITNTKIDLGVTQGEIDQAKGNVNNAETNSNNAVNNYNAVRNRDSSEGADLDNKLVTDKFCRRNPNDTSCTEWRSMRGMQPTPK